MVRVACPGEGRGRTMTLYVEPALDVERLFRLKP
jgi:hypothetical protein